MTPSPSSFLIDALHADRPAPDRADRMGLYAFLVGRWEMDAVYPLEDGTARRARGEIHAGWVLEGRALQDVWIVPARGTRAAEPQWGDFYGTTLRVYDPALDAWHILWSDPLKQVHLRQLGRAEGRDIVQLGKADPGILTRWSFREITASSFHWLGERSADDGARWQLQVEFFARRLAG
jgi:hypothetical protein